MANERVSQLLELYAGELASSDLFLITDMSQRESKKLPLSSLMEYIENSGSFIATDAATAETASYVAGVNVHGTVTSASYSARSSLSDSSSYSVKSSQTDSASHAAYASVAGALAGGIGTVVSSSHALRTDWADNAAITSYLYYSGVNNGIASTALTASYSDLFSLGYSGADPTVLRPINMYGAVNDGVQLFFSGSIDDGYLYFRTFDNGTEGYKWQTHQSSGGGPIIDRMWLTHVTSSYGTAKLRVYGDVSASAYTASITNGQVGFVGTASHALTASSLVSTYASIKAWAWVTWSAGHVSSCSLYKGSNIGTVTYMTSSHPDASNTIDHFTVTFNNTLPTNDYMFLGSTFACSANYSGTPIDGKVTLFPLWSTWQPRLTTDFTMSLWTLNSVRSLFYSGFTQVNFQIVQ